MTAVPGGAVGPAPAEGGRPSHHTRHATNDRDEAEKVIEDLFLPNRLDLAGGTARLGMEVAGLRLGALTAGRLTYGRRVRLRTADATNFHVNIPMRGRAVSRSGAGGRRCRSRGCTARGPGSGSR